MNQWLFASSALLKTSGALLLLVCAVEVWRVGEATRSSIAATPELSRHISRAWRETLDQRLSSMETTFASQVSSIATLTDARLGSLERATDARLAAIQKDAQVELQATRTALVGQVIELRGQIQPVLADAQLTMASARGLMAQTGSLVADAQKSWDDIFWDVKAAIESGTVAARSVAEAASAVEKATPVILDATSRFTKDSAEVASNINHLTKPKWYDRLIGYGLNGIIIYRNLHPATNFVLKSVSK